MFVPNKQNASGRKHTGPPITDAVFDLESQWFCVNICLLTLPCNFLFFAGYIRQLPTLVPASLTHYYY